MERPSARPRTAAATVAAASANQQYATERAVDDPVKLARAARIIRLALERNRLSVSDLTLPASEQEAA